MFFNNFIISQDVSGSRLPVGSSHIKIGGSFTIALAIETLCCSPPDNSFGFDFSLSAKPTIAMILLTRGLISFDLVLVISKAKAIFSYAVLFGNNLKSWKTTPVFLRILGTRLACILVIFSPSNTILPFVGSNSFNNNFMSVDLPAPLGPTTKTNSPSFISKSNPFSAFTPFG